jgi:hypothetical protein
MKELLIILKKHFAMKALIVSVIMLSIFAVFMQIVHFFNLYRALGEIVYSIGYIGVFTSCFGVLFSILILVFITIRHYCRIRRSGCKKL